MDKKSKNWLEIMGCGLVHPNVIDMAGLDSKKNSPALPLEWGLKEWLSSYMK